MHQISEDQQRTTASILDEYCRYYSDFSKILGIYIKQFYPQVHFQFDQLLDASYNVWHRLKAEEKISLGSFLEEINREYHHDISSSSKMKTSNNLINSEFLAKKLQYPISSSSKAKKNLALTPYQIYLKDERPKLMKKHAQMSMRDINQRLSLRWQKMSHRMKENYHYRSYLAKKRFYQTQGQSIQLKKPPFIQRISSKTR